MQDESAACSTCAWNKRDRETHEWTCSNEESECFGCFTGYSDSCDEYEARG